MEKWPGHNTDYGRKTYLVEPNSRLHDRRLPHHQSKLLPRHRPPQSPENTKRLN